MANTFNNIFLHFGFKLNAFLNKKKNKKLNQVPNIILFIVKYIFYTFICKWSENLYCMLFFILNQSFIRLIPDEI